MTRPRKPMPAAPPPGPYFPETFEEMADAYARAAILLRELEKEEAAAHSRPKRR